MNQVPVMDSSKMRKFELDDIIGYQSVSVLQNENVPIEKFPILPNSTHSSHHCRYAKFTRLSLGAVVLLFFTSMFLYLFIGQIVPVAVSAPDPEHIEKSSFECPPCDFHQCEGSLCEYPFMCTGGAANGGCASLAGDWPKSGVCSSCCNRQHCDATIAAGSEDSRACTKCSTSQCSRLASISRQRCGRDAPFVCVEGSARMGCSADKFAWLAGKDTLCSECCESSTCT